MSEEQAQVVEEPAKEQKPNEIEQLKELYGNAFNAVHLNLISRDKMHYGKRLSGASLNRVIRAFTTYTLDDTAYNKLNEQEKNVVAAIQMLSEIKLGLRNEIVKEYEKQTGKPQGEQTNG